MTLLDAGCGPGSLTKKFADWLGTSSFIIGVDRDTAFIKYAQKKAEEATIENIKFIKGDVLALPLKDNCVDASISYTVIEHVPNHEFLLEQKRVCRSGGVVSVMMAQPKSRIHSTPSTIPQVSEQEKELWAPIAELQRLLHKESMTGKYNPKPYDLPILFNELGLSDIQVDALALPVVPDDYRNDDDEKTAILESYRIEAIENIDRMLSLFPDKFLIENVAELKSLIDKRFSRRLALLEKGIAVWDYTVEMVLVVSGIV
jgi:SAM-dependent methyltransferase